MNWNKFGSGSRDLGDLLYLMNGESALKSFALHPPPSICFNRNHAHKGRLIQYKPLVKCPPRNPADKVHYIVRFRDWRLTHSVTLALDVPKMGTIGSGEFNNRRLVAFQLSFSFQDLSERESSTSRS